MTFKGRKLTFIKGRLIGGGGNGKVYEVKCIPPEKERLVVKVLKSSNGRYTAKKYKRFKHEVETVVKLSGKIEGILPLIDSDLPENPSENAPPWFVMPYAMPLKQSIFYRGLQIVEKMHIIKDIGIILLGIHGEGYSHRDIKLDNLLMYEGKVVFSDFGLVWHDQFERLTGVNEPVGPWNTIAPEMKRYAYAIKDARPADVYSFAKLIWIILTEDESCFDGQYSKEKHFSLEYFDFGVESLECIHQLLMESTNDDFTRRPMINDVLNQIDKWFEILSNGKLLLEEKRLVLRNQIKEEFTPSTETFTQLDVILEILRKIIQSYSLRGNQFNEIFPKRCTLSNVHGCLEISDDLRTYILKPAKLMIENRTALDFRYILDVEDIDEKVIAPFKEKVVIQDEGSFIDNILGGNLIKNTAKIVLSGEKGIMIEAY